MRRHSTTPHTHQPTDLIVPAAPRVQLAAHIADQLCQAALVGGVDVFVSRLDHKATSSPLGSNLCGMVRVGRYPTHTTMVR
jgi:hypothetical protein